jgi:PKD repeat protein
MKRSLLLAAIILIATAMNAQLKRSVPEHNPVPSLPVITNPAAPTTVQATVFQDFESYTDFSLLFPPWTVIDVDGFATFGIEGYTYPHMNEAMAYIAFNPAATTPPSDGDPDLTPHSGYRFAASFASQSHPNDDWMISPQIALGANGHFKFWVKSYTSTYGLERYRVGVSTTNTQPSSFTIISAGSYLEAATTWTQQDYDLSAYAGMNIYVAIECVSNDAFIFMLDDLEVTSETAVTSTLTGKVTDAVNGEPIANALVSVGGLEDYTDQNGDYLIANIPAGVLNANFTANTTSGAAPLAVQFTDLSGEGTQTVTATASGYSNYTNSGIVIPAGGTLELHIALSPTLATGQYRFVLTWGEQPLDLDSHLKTPLIEGTAYHIYYQNQGSSTSPPYVILDIDDVSSFGPETTTIYDLFTGDYHYYIYNYSQSPAITTSNAVVQIFNENGLIQTLQVPTTGDGMYWDICTLNGSNGNISVINQITSTEPGGMPFLAPGEMKEKPQVPANRNITSWQWNFGDGGTSTAQNPSHTYTYGGSFNVSLTISDGTNSDIETKNAYVTVTGGSGGTSTLTGMVTDAVNGNPVANALVSVAGLSATTDASGNYTINNIPAGVLNANFNANVTTGNAPLAVQFTDQSQEGTHTVTASATGYTTYTNSSVVIPDGGSLTLQISLSPTLTAGQYRFVLTWGETPTDLDSHMKTPEIEGSTYHVYYDSQGSASTAPYVILDIDDITSFGPETTTIYDLKTGTYHYYIHNYSGSPDIITSNAVVQIFNDNGLINTLQVPTSGTGLYWDVCTLNGSTGAISIINTIVGTEPGGMPLLTPDQLEKKPLVATGDRNIVSWNWNFGDGGTSTSQNPSHTYSANGSYTVSLTVSDGTNSNTELKNAYILVGPAGVDEAAWEKEVRIYPNPVKNLLHINSGVTVKSVNLVDLNGLEKMRKNNCSTNFTLELGNIPAGIYILSVDTENGMMQRKITITK